MSSVETLSALERRLNSSFPQSAIASEVEARLKRIGRTAKAAGFRPGKVPFKILQQQYGGEVLQEVLNEQLQQAFTAAAKEHNLSVVGYPQFELKSAADADPVEYSATFEIYPEIVLGDLSGETVERVSYTLSDADIDNTLNTLRKQRGTFAAVDRAAAANDDQVRIDFRGTLNGEMFAGGEATNFAFVLGAGRMLPDFEAAALGMKAGETKSFDMTFPEDYHGKDVAGKQVTFAITVHAVEAMQLPELNSEFAQALGVTDGDVEKLRAEVRTNLSREIKRRLKVRNKDNAMDALLKVGQVELPKTMLAWETQSLQQQAVRDMEGRGMKIPAGMMLPPELFADRAQKRVKLGLLLNELMEKHDLAAKPEQVRVLLEEYAESFEQPEEVVRWHYGDPSRLAEVENLALEDNVVAHVQAAAKVTERAIDFKELMEQQ